MKRLKFKKLWLLSTKEQKAWNASLSDDINVIVADNEFGKSSFVKSLYATLGAEPHKTPESWRQAQVSSLLEFSINDLSYSMLREGPFFTLFDGGNSKLWTTNGVTKGLAPKLAEMLDFKIELTAKGGVPAAPLPALCFMPFYIDQDNGWNETWESFAGTGMITNPKPDLANFHTGIRPKEYYVAKAGKTAATQEKSALSQDRNALTRAENRLKQRRTTVGLPFSPEVFAERIQILLAEQNTLQKQYDLIKAKVSDLQSQRSMAFEEMEIAGKILDELNADLKFVEGIGDTEIHCPICNTVHKNDFANRFGLSHDADACRTVFLDSQKKVAELDAAIAIALQNIPKIQDGIDRISVALDEKRGEVKLGDMLRDESERMVDEAFVNEGKSVDHLIGEVDQKINAAVQQMKKFDDKTHKNTITDFYVERLKAFAADLSIDIVPNNMYTSIRPVIGEVGSSKPRLLLAYYYAIMHTIEKFSTACFCPIIVDTPLQQDQDPSNSERMIRFAIEKKPVASQLILATGSLHGVTFSGTTIVPSNKKSLLQEDQYDLVREYLTPFVTLSMK